MSCQSNGSETLLSIEDQGVTDLLAFCVDAFFRKRPGFTIPGDYAGSARDYFPCFLADGFQCVGVNALPRIRIHIGVAGNRVVLAVVVGSGLKIDRLP